MEVLYPKKTNPKDYDACWESEGIDFNLLANKYPILIIKIK